MYCSGIGSGSVLMFTAEGVFVYEFSRMKLEWNARWKWTKQSQCMPRAVLLFHAWFDRKANKCDLSHLVKITQTVWAPVWICVRHVWSFIKSLVSSHHFPLPIEFNGWCYSLASFLRPPVTWPAPNRQHRIYFLSKFVGIILLAGERLIFFRFCSIPVLPHLPHFVSFRLISSRFHLIIYYPSDRVTVLIFSGYNLSAWFRVQFLSFYHLPSFIFYSFDHPFILLFCYSPVCLSIPFHHTHTVQFFACNKTVASIRFVCMEMPFNFFVIYCQPCLFIISCLILTFDGSVALRTPVIRCSSLRSRKSRSRFDSSRKAGFKSLF